MTRKLKCPDCGDPKKKSDFYYKKTGELISPRCRSCFNKAVKLNAIRRKLNRNGITKI